jgi:uncharacterized membrane protein
MQARRCGIMEGAAACRIPRRAGGAPMRIPAAIALLAFAAAARSEGQFILLQSPDIMASAVSGNGQYVAADDYSTMGVRWSALDGSETWITSIQLAFGINNTGTIAGTVFEDGGAYQGGHHLAAFAAIGAEPVLLDHALAPNSIAFDLSDDGTVVGKSFDSPTGDADFAFVWTAVDGMSALPVPRPQHPSCATSISADGRVIAGWNGSDDGKLLGVVWIDGTPMDIVDADGRPVGEAWDVTGDGRYVVGGKYTDIHGTAGAWRWDEDAGVTLIDGLDFATGISADGRTVVGGTDPFSIPPSIQSVVWREGIGPMPLTEYLAEVQIEVPQPWSFGNGLSDISADGHVLTGWGIGPLGVQSYVVRILGDSIFADGFDP